jgi:tRNA threonylcarbamoyladenosine biosynthesis protein TsaE
MGAVELVSESAADTERVAEAIAGGLRRGDVVMLSGDVGTGKTTFVRGACRALGARENVTSPSFTIGRRYAGRTPISHLDLFRLDGLEGEDPGLLVDYLDAETISFMEWPKDLPLVFAFALPPEHEIVVVRLSHLGADRRRLEVTGREDLVERIPA